ncbi:hypothetical protein DIPPA_20324 [Diplonema papillatum]|nr:hypothetical protein DIPPA_20324 [Diplonema papillatum]
MDRASLCYANTAALSSVQTRSDAFIARVKRSHPHLSEDLVFLMWLQLKLERKDIAPVSARQYMTYRNMLKVDPATAFRRALARELKEFERRAQDSRVLVNNQQVWGAIAKMTGLHRAALATQWSLGARFIDLIRLETSQVVACPKDPRLILVVLVYGKTDRSGKGQPLLVERAGRFTHWMLEWWNRRVKSGKKYMFYPELRTTPYNEVLTVQLGLKSHGIRHSALTWVARFADDGEDSAQVVGRHKQVETTRQYIPHYLWGSAQGSVAPLKLLQR